MDSKPTRTRRVYHWKFCDRLERPFCNYGNVIANVVKAAQTRVFVNSTAWDPPQSFKVIMRRAAALLAQQTGPALSEPELEQVVAKFPEKKRRMYQDGLKEQLDLKKHSQCTGFIKQENVPHKSADKPRVIQFRDPVYLAHLLPVMKPIEHSFYHNRYCFNKYQKLTCAKGMDPLARMKCLTQMVTEVEDPVFLGLDGSAFDAHVSPGALKAEWKFYREVLVQAGYHPSAIHKFDQMGRCQLRNKVKFRCEDGFASYTVDGNRMSGDLNTGLGNSVLQSGFIASLMKEAGVPDANWRMLVDGDDAVVIVTRKYAPSAAFITATFARFSQDVKLEGPFPVSPDSMEAIDFCQSRPVRVDGEWRMMRNPYKVYNCYKMQCVYYRSLEESRRFLATVAKPEMIYSSGVPVHMSLFTAFHRMAADAQPLDAVGRRFWLRHAEASNIGFVDQVSWPTRLSYAKAFGISPLDQLLIEQELDLLTPEDLSNAGSWLPSVTSLTEG